MTNALIKGMIGGAVSIILFLLLVSTSIYFAVPHPWKLYGNSIFTFRIPPTWSCKRTHLFYECYPFDKGEQKVAMVIATSKIAGENDNEKDYRAHIAAPRIANSGNRKVTSKPLSQIDKVIDGKTWITGTQLGSELPGFITHYYARVEKDIATLITVTYNVELEDRYSDLPDDIARSINLTW